MQPGSETCNSKLRYSDEMTIKPQKKSTYRHIPHSEKPPHLVARRNARERKRVQAVNNAFLKLRKHVPCENKNKRLSKVKTLQFAIDYIVNLQNMIDEHDRNMAGNFEQSVADYNRGMFHNGETAQRYSHSWSDDGCEVTMTFVNIYTHSKLFFLMTKLNTY